MSCTSFAKVVSEPGRGESRPPVYPRSMRTAPLRPTEIKVADERSDEKDHITPHLSRLTWSMYSVTNMRPNPTQRESEAKKPMLRYSMDMSTHKQLEVRLSFAQQSPGKLVAARRPPQGF